MRAILMQYDNIDDYQEALYNTDDHDEFWYFLPGGREILPIQRQWKLIYLNDDVEKCEVIASSDQWCDKWEQMKIRQNLMNVSKIISKAIHVAFPNLDNLAKGFARVAKIINDTEKRNANILANIWKKD